MTPSYHLNRARRYRCRSPNFAPGSIADNETAAPHPHPRPPPARNRFPRTPAGARPAG